MADPTSLLKDKLPVIRASAACGNELALALLTNYDLWLRMKDDPNAASYANGVQFAFDRWWKAENDKLQ
jgi:hypothetical protein